MHKIVPIEPTQSMCTSGQQKASEWQRFPLKISAIYKAMLSAAPDVNSQAVLKVVADDISYRSHHDDQSYGMWCPVGFGKKHGFSEGTLFYTTPQPDRTDELQEQVLQLQDKVKRLEDELAVKTDEADGLRKLYELLIKECYSLDQEEYEDDGEYRFKWASLAIEQAKTKLTKLEKVNIDLEADKARLVEALRMWDETIKHQYTGSSQAMSYLQECAFVTQKLLAEINETSGFIGGDKC